MCVPARGGFRLSLRHEFEQHRRTSHFELYLRAMEQAGSNTNGDDETKWQEATDAAESALKARVMLWDGILGQLKMTVS